MQEGRYIVFQSDADEIIYDLYMEFGEGFIYPKDNKKYHQYLEVAKQYLVDKGYIQTNEKKDGNN